MMEHLLVPSLTRHHVLVAGVGQVQSLLLCDFVWAWELVDVGRSALLVRVTFVDGSVDCSNGAASCLAWGAWGLRPTWPASHWIIIHVHIVLVYLDWLRRALASMHVVEWGLSILSCSRDHPIGILGVQSATKPRLDDLISWVLLLRILLIDHILLELSLLLLLQVLVCLLQWNLLDVHLLLLHATLADYGCLVRVESWLLLVVGVGWLDHNPSDVGAVLESVVPSHMPSDDRLGAWVLWLLSLRVDAQSVIVLLLLGRPIFFLHLCVKCLSFFKYLHQFRIYLITI